MKNFHLTPADARALTQDELAAEFDRLVGILGDADDRCNEEAWPPTFGCAQPRRPRRR